MNFTENLVVVLVATRREYRKGQVDSCLKKYFNCRASKDKKIDLYIFFNKPGDYDSLLEYKNYENVNDVKIISHNFNALDDLYARNPAELSSLYLAELPKLGGSAGANNLFFDSMIPMCDSSYRYCLMIETDSQPIIDFWIDGIIDYCEDNQFLIGGSLYKGQHTLYTFGSWTGHLNGIAVYRLCNKLKTLLQYSRKLIEVEVAMNGVEFLSFDCAIHQFTCSLTGGLHYSNRNSPENHLIDTPIISNFSLEQDSKTTIESVKKQYPQTIILHKK